MQIEIRTSDHAWAARYARPGRDGRVITQVRKIKYQTVQSTGTELVMYQFTGPVPADLTPYGFAPTDWIIQE